MLSGIDCSLLFLADSHYKHGMHAAATYVSSSGAPAPAPEASPKPAGTTGANSGGAESSSRYDASHVWSTCCDSSHCDMCAMTCFNLALSQTYTTQRSHRVLLTCLCLVALVPIHALLANFALISFNRISFTAALSGKQSHAVSVMM